MSIVCRWFKFLATFTGRGLWYIFLGTFALGGEWWAFAIAISLVSVGGLNLFTGVMEPKKNKQESSTNNENNNNNNKNKKDIFSKNKGTDDSEIKITLENAKKANEINKKINQNTGGNLYSDFY